MVKEQVFLTEAVDEAQRCSQPVTVPAGGLMEQKEVGREGEESGAGDWGLLSCAEVPGAGL